MNQEQIKEARKLCNEQIPLLWKINGRMLLPAALDEIERLQSENQNLKDDQSRLCSEMLSALSGVICTPAEGYEKAGLGCIVRDVRELVKAFVGEEII
jgi:hypothetical protein